MTSSGVRVSRNVMGFTLVELLVAITLFGMLFSVLYGSLRLGAKTSTVVRQLTERDHSDQSGRSLLRRSIENALLFVTANGTDYLTGDPTFKVSFDGGSQSLRYVSEVISSDGLRQPHVFDLRYNEIEESIELRYSDDRPIRQAWTEELTGKAVLAEGISALSIEYLFENDRVSSEWVSEWKRMSDAPDLVRIAVLAHGREWPDLVIQPRNSLDMRHVDDAL